VDPIHKNLYNIVFPHEAQLTQQQLDALSGTYEIQRGFDFRIWSENGKIFGQAPGQEVLPLFAENELTLFAKAVIVKIQFEKNKQGKISCLYIMQHGDKIRAEKK
jgi:hypothetical protein